MGRVALAPLLLAVALVATACGERSEPTGPDVSLYPVTIQTGRDRPLVVSGPARRVVALSDSAAATVRSLGTSVVGVPINRSGRIRFTALRRLRPDLIVAPAETDDLDLSRAADVTGVQPYVVPGGSIEEVERAITQLGLLTGRPAEARGLVRTIEQRRAQAHARLASSPIVTVFIDLGFFTTAPDHSLLADLVTEARGRNVAATRTEPGPLDPADVVKLDPDVYLTTSESRLTLKELRRDPATRKLRAVTEGRFVVVDSDLLAPGPGVGDALLQIARLLHPDAFR